MNWQFTIDIETPDSGLVVARELGEMLVSWLQITKLNGQIMGFNIETGLPPEKINPHKAGSVPGLYT